MNKLDNFYENYVCVHLNKKTAPMKFILVLFFLNTSFSSKQINTIYIQKELKWLLIGLPDDNRAKNILAKMYGF